MHLVTSLCLVAVVAAGVPFPAAASAQAPPAKPQAQRAGVPDAELKRARQLLEASRYDEATAFVDNLLATTPRDRRLYDLKIEARTGARDYDGVLSTYDDFIAVNQLDDAALLARVARSELARVAASETTDRFQALSALARAGDASSKAELQKLAAQTKDQSAAAAARSALARAGDAAALKEIVELARAGGRAQILAALALPPRADVTVEESRPAIVAGLRHADVIVQEKALQAAALSADPTLVDDVRKLASASDKVVQLRAAVALHRLGVAQQDLLGKYLKSGPPDAQVIAAGAFAGTDGPWKAAIRPLLASPDATYRIDAAELLAGEPGSSEVLEAALEDTNLYVRSEAVRVLTTTGKASLPMLRHLLRDSSTAVRLQAAEALVEPSRKR